MKPRKGKTVWNVAPSWWKGVETEFDARVGHAISHLLQCEIEIVGLGSQGISIIEHPNQQAIGPTPAQVASILEAIPVIVNTAKENPPCCRLANRILA